MAPRDGLPSLHSGQAHLAFMTPKSISSNFFLRDQPFKVFSLDTASSLFIGPSL